MSLLKLYKDTNCDERFIKRGYSIYMSKAKVQMVSIMENKGRYFFITHSVK